MLKRVKQVLAACTAVIRPDDRGFVDLWLSQEEQRLFWAMSLPEQYHALQVAYTAHTLAMTKKNVNEVLLTRCALLHDVGKVSGDISTLDKVLAVLLYNFLPNQACRWQAYGRGGWVQNFRHALYIYEHHPQIGYKKLISLGLEEIARIIVRHHAAELPDDPVELRLLREADEMN